MVEASLLRLINNDLIISLISHLQYQTFFNLINAAIGLPIEVP